MEICRGGRLSPCCAPRYPRCPKAPLLWDALALVGAAFGALCCSRAPTDCGFDIVCDPCSTVSCASLASMSPNVALDAACRMAALTPLCSLVRESSRGVFTR